MTSKHNLIKGSIFMIIAFFFIAVFGSLLKEAGESGSKIWVTFIAYLSAFILHAIYMWEKPSFLKTKRIVRHFFRGFFGVAATVLYIWAMHSIPLLDATLLFNTTPLFIPLLSIFFLKSKVTWKIWLSVVIGFIGVVLILKPTDDIFKEIGDILGLASGLFLALAFIQIKLLTATEPGKRITFYFFLFGTLLMIPFLFFAEAPPLKTWIFGSLAGVSFVLTQIFIVKAYQCAEAHDMGAFQYSSVVFAGIIEWIFWHQTPTILTVIGVVLVIIGGSLVILLSDNKKETIK